MEDLQELENKLNLLEPQRQKVWEEYMDKSLEGIPWDVARAWYFNQSVIKEYLTTERKIRSLKEPKYFDPIEKDDDIYPLNIFIGICKGGGFIDYDGFGVYAYEDKKSDINVYPSDITEGIYRKDFTHIVWYNR